MVSSRFNCKKVFQKAYENRYTWPENFNGYKGNCIFRENKEIDKQKKTSHREVFLEIKN